ncbi:MAG: DNA-3-methyladenine glycosylase I [Candidatus Aenigmarchaeota archaeon]|nr:DNA-3-methyladenine glycosylase I [Candidatus Aenigmarchaeota archaeon]
MKVHTAPWECTYAKEDSNVCKPGKGPSSDDEYFEILSLTILQSGLSWSLVRKKWPKIKEAFHNFSINEIVELKSKDVKLLLKNPNVIRNERKIKAIINNSKQFEKIVEEYESFKKFLEKLKNESLEKRINELVKRFKHVGK